MLELHFLLFVPSRLRGEMQGFPQHAAASFDLNLDKHKLLVSWVDDIVLDAYWPRVRLAKLQLGCDASG